MILSALLERSNQITLTDRMKMLIEKEKLKLEGRQRRRYLVLYNLWEERTLNKIVGCSAPDRLE